MSEKMTDTEATRYTQLLLSGKLKLGNPLEAKTLEMLMGTQAELQKLMAKSQMLAAETERTQAKFLEMKGQRSGFITLLLLAEEARRETVARHDGPMTEDPETGEVIPLRIEPPALPAEGEEDAKDANGK